MRFDLELPISRRKLVDLLSHKDNHVKFDWSILIQKMNFHGNEIQKGNDYYTDGILHSVHVQYYSSLLTEYYSTHPNGDDRKHSYLNIPNIGLDIDEVLANWVDSWIKLYGMEKPTAWSFDRQIIQRFDDMRLAGTLNDFYLGLEPKIKGSELPFEPVCYITSRPVISAVTEEWLHMHGFPSKPVYTVPVYESKIKAAKEANVEIFVDDGWHNFKELNKNGICCYLFDAPHNQKYDVGYKRIKSLKELPCIQLT